MSSREIIRILLLEDDPIVGESLKERLELEGIQCDWFAGAGAALDALQAEGYGLVLSDIRMPGMDGEAFFEALKGRVDPVPPTVFITGYGSIEQAVRLLRRGAADYLTKPLDIHELLVRIRELAVRSPVGLSEDQEEAVAPGMRPFFERIPRLAPHPEVVVLIQGESGVGKEVLARHIHELLMPDEPFEAVNCAALPEQLAASELFGHEKGAFTGAQHRHVGSFERAGKGVLFLDEIGDMPLELQVQLLRVIQERVFQRVGGERALPFEGRLVCATHQDLPQLVREGRFREDLYYRLNVVQFQIPPLRKRPADILWLAEQFLAENAARVGRETPPMIDEATRDALLAYRWPGNVRELKNLIDRACIFCDGERLTPELLGLPTALPETGLRSAREEAERERIVEALELNNWRMQRTAQVLGVSRKTLWEKMKKLRIERAG